MKDFEDRGSFFEGEGGDMGNMEEMINNDLDIVSMGLDAKLLETSIEIAKSGWFWRFRRLNTKLKMIEETYTRLDKLLRGEG